MVFPYRYKKMDKEEDADEQVAGDTTETSKKKSSWKNKFKRNPKA